MSGNATCQASGTQSVNTSAFIATNPEALLPHSIASTPPLGANLLTPNSLRRGAWLGGPELGSLDCEHVFDRLLPTVEHKLKEPTVPLDWKKGHHHSMVDRTSRFLESTTLLQKPMYGPTGRSHLHTCDDDLDLGRAAVDEEFDAVDET
jgi:hypothetical protein